MSIPVPDDEPCWRFDPPGEGLFHGPVECCNCGRPRGAHRGRTFRAWKAEVDRIAVGIDLRRGDVPEPAWLEFLRGFYQENLSPADAVKHLSEKGPCEDDEESDEEPWANPSGWKDGADGLDG